MDGSIHSRIEGNLLDGSIHSQYRSEGPFTLIFAIKESLGKLVIIKIMIDFKVSYFQIIIIMSLH